MKIFATAFFISCVFLFSRADRAHDAIKYLDEVLSVYLPWAIEEAGLEVYGMPNFSTNFQNRSSDGTHTSGKVFYHSGNVTGLQSVYRQTCNQPTWTSSNLTTHCKIAFPIVNFKYEARIQVLDSLSNNVRFRQKDFGVHGDIKEMQANLSVTVSPHTKIPSIKSLTIINGGTPSLRFMGLDEVSFELLSSHFYHKFNDLFHEVFYDLYGKAFERAVESIPFPI